MTAELPDSLPEQVVEIIKQEFQGPLPPPAVLAAYEQVVPGFAERIMTMAERNQQHRQQTIDAVVQRSFQQGRRAQLCALTVSLVLIGCSTAMVLKGHDEAGATLGTTTIVALAGAFLAPRLLGGRDAYGAE